MRYQVGQSITILISLLMVAVVSSFSPSTVPAATGSNPFQRLFHLNIQRRERTSKGGRRNEPRSKSRHTIIGQRKVSRLLRDELSDIITNCDIKASNYPDEDLMRSVSIADVEYSSDLSYAKVYISIMGNAVEKRQVFVWLCNHMNQLRYSLSQRLKNLRRLPEIRFSLVDSQSTYYLNEILDDIGEPISEDEFFEEDIQFEEVE